MPVGSLGSPFLHVAFRSTASYTLDVRCPAGCDATTLGPEDDPLRGHFRPWTAGEVRRIIHDPLQGHVPICPVCDNGIFASVHTNAQWRPLNAGGVETGPRSRAGGQAG